MHKIRAILKEYITLSPERSAIFFKTGKGEYAQYDQFLGVTVPHIRKVAKIFADIDLNQIEQLLSSKINEERLLALFIITGKYKKADPDEQEKIYQFYLKNLQYINNWNLVDASAHLIIGAHLLDKDRGLLFDLAQSKIMWERRIAIVATWYFIRQNDLKATFEIAKTLLEDEHDLIHKAAGWMLREAGKKDLSSLLRFLDEHKHKMPRTMLRYAIERLNEEQRREYLLSSRN